jgi:large subunit ribosomal protein L17
MRHRKQRSKLGMMTAHRDAMLKNMAKNILKFQRIETTVARAKVARRLVEHLITVSKNDSVTSRRIAYSILNDRDLVAKLFKEVGPLFNARSSGFTRIIPTGFRRGDGANLCIFELTERKIVEKHPKKKKEKAAKEGRSAESVKAKPEPRKEKEAGEEAREAKIKTIPKSKPTLAEEKKSEKAKSEDRKMTDKKGFMKNLRGFFRRKTDM